MCRVLAAGKGLNGVRAMTDVRVECYAGYKGEETPRRFFLGKREIEVAEVVDRWLDPDHRYFKVLGDDGGLYILRHDVSKARWELASFTPPNPSA